MVSKARAVLLAVLALAAPLAGCAGDPSPDDPADGDDGEDEPQGTDAPRWRLGHAWDYTIDTEGFPETETTMMVYNETANLYRVGSTDERQALIHSLFNVNPQLGRMQKGNLAVFEDGEPRAMYDFPLEDGKTWQTEFFISQHGGTLDAEATKTDAIQTSFGTFEGYEITATNSAGFEVVYDYVPEVKWFTKLVVTDAEGTQLHDLRLTGFEEGRSGTGYFVRGDDLHDATYTSDECGFPTGCSDNVLVDGASAKDGKYGPYDLVAYNVVVEMEDEDNDRASIEITDGDGNTIYSRQDLTESQGDEFSFETVEDFEPGDWTVDAQADGSATIDVRLAGAWSYSGDV